MQAPDEPRGDSCRLAMNLIADALPDLAARIAAVEARVGDLAAAAPPDAEARIALQDLDLIRQTVADLAAGDHAEITRVVSEADVAAFVEAVGDHNPIHSDPGYAAATPFGEPIAPGIFTAGLISAVIGTRLPGPGAIYLSQSLTFLKPVRAGDTITARAEVTEVVRARNRIRIRQQPNVPSRPVRRGLALRSAPAPDAPSARAVRNYASVDPEW